MSQVSSCVLHDNDGDDDDDDDVDDDAFQTQYHHIPLLSFPHICWVPWCCSTAMGPLYSLAWMIRLLLLMWYFRNFIRHIAKNHFKYLDLYIQLCQLHCMMNKYSFAKSHGRFKNRYRPLSLWALLRLILNCQYCYVFAFYNPFKIWAHRLQII